VASTATAPGGNSGDWPRGGGRPGGGGGGCSPTGQASGPGVLALTRAAACRAQLTDCWRAMLPGGRLLTRRAAAGCAVAAGASCVADAAGASGASVATGATGASCVAVAAVAAGASVATDACVATAGQPTDDSRVNGGASGADG